MGFKKIVLNQVPLGKVGKAILFLAGLNCNKRGCLLCGWELLEGQTSKLVNLGFVFYADIKLLPKSLYSSGLYEGTKRKIEAKPPRKQNSTVWIYFFSFIETIVIDNVLHTWVSDI